MKNLLILISFVLTLLGCEANKKVKNQKIPSMTNESKPNLETAIIGGGCFWCTEAVFERIKGVKEVISGYAGGKVLNPTYRQICTGTTGHAEVIKIIFDPKDISFKEILELFGDAHDPTTLNRQGADEGTQYRSTIMFLNDSQQKTAMEWKSKLSEKLVDPVVTEIVKAPVFYDAEEYHQDYYRKNPNQGYCNFVIRPKLKKLNLE
ncbi:MAG: peptide-methionine (S)-S-oxide reductase [Verrucomicrobia bacterium TMED44]|nr:MAG: peptide-methionine (S)-S-oxide reductase [Verrucomicrobia bacterium TMED44]